jgi:cytochrome c553
MLPPPPELAVTMRPWQPNDLFWIVKNGLKYTGMPGWVAIERDDEIWAVVAFLTHIQKLDAETYRGLALGDVRLSQQNGAELATLQSFVPASSACARCHGYEGNLPLSNLVPVVHGQPSDYLLASLKAYSEGKRRSGIMQPLAADLRPEDIRELADYYAGLPLPQLQSKGSDAALVSAAENWLSKVDPKSAFCLAQRVTTIPGAFPVLPASTLRTRQGNCDFGKQASALPLTAGLR